MGAEHTGSARRWRDVLPGLGLTLGAVLALFATLIISPTPTTIALWVVAGAAVGVVAGSVARTLLYRDPNP